MISLALGIAVALAALQANPTAQSRQAYSKCLATFMKQALKDGMDPGGFGGAAKTACASQEAAFRNASIAYDMRMGGNRAQAEEDAGLQVDDYMASIEDSYAVHHEGGKTPKPD